MNKVFKVIWCKTTQTMIVVSELAKSGRRKSGKTQNIDVKVSSSNVFTKTALVTAMLLAGVNSAYAACSTNNSITCGTNASASDNGVAIGDNAQASSSGLAVGNGAQASSSGLAVGNGAKAGEQGLAVGSGTVAKKGAIAAGTTNTKAVEYSQAFGWNAQALGEVSFAQGTWARANGHGGISMGHKTYASGNGSIAMGGIHHIKVVNGKAVAAYNYREDGGKALSIGSIAIGTGTVAGTKEGSVKDGGGWHNQSGGVEQAAALGYHVKATGDKSIALGFGESYTSRSEVSGDRSGSFGSVNNVSADTSYALGNNNTIAQENTFVLGSGVTTSQANSVVLGNASADRAATEVKQATVGSMTYGGFAGVGKPDNGVVSVGADKKERQLINVAAGEISATSTDAINGSQLHAVAKTMSHNNPFEYQDKDGNSVVKIGDKYYPAGSVVNANGDVVDAAGDPANEILNDNIVIHAKDASPKPITNVKSVIGHDKGDGKINENDAKAATEGLLNNTEDLSTAATAGDLQAVAQAGLNFKGDDDTVIHKPLSGQLDIVGGADKTKLTDNNIGVNSADGKLKVQLAKDLKGLASTQFVNANGDNTIKINGNAQTITGLKDTITVPVDKATSGTAPAGNQSGVVATVNDILNAGWNLQNNTTPKDFVQAYDTVNFADGEGTKVVVENTDGKTSTIKVNVDAQVLSETAQLPVVYTDADGNKVYKQNDGTFNTSPDGSGDSKQAGDVIASMQNAKGEIKPTKLANVGDGAISATSKDAVNGSQIKGMADSVANAIGGGSTVGADGKISAPSFTLTNGDPSDGGTTAYTSVGDALMGLNTAVTKPITFTGDEGSNEQKLGSSFKIATGTAKAGFIGDNLHTKVEGNKVTVGLSETPDFKTVTVGEAGKKVTIGGQTITGLKDTITAPADPEVGVAPTNIAAGTVATVNDVLRAGWNLQVGGKKADFVQAYDTVNFKGKDGITVTHKTDSDGVNNIEIGLKAGTISNTAGSATGNGDNFVTANTVANAINNAGHTVTAKNTDDVVTENTESSLIKNGQALTVEAGKNLSASMDKANGTLKISTKTKVDFDNVKVGDVAINKDTGINAGKKQITNVASGLGNRTLDQIKSEGDTAAEWNNAATVGDLTKVQGNVTNISNNINKIIGGIDADGNATNANGDVIKVKDENGNEVNLTVKEALKTYNPQSQGEYTTNSVPEAIYRMNEGGIKYFHTNDGTANYDEQDTNKVDSSAKGKFSTAIGFQASTGKEAKNALAFGNGAQANAEDSIAIGTGNIVNAKHSGAFGDPSYIAKVDVDNNDVDGSYSLGNNNVINSSNTFVLGNNVNNSGETEVLKDAKGNILKDKDGKPRTRPVAQGDTVENSVYLGNKTTATKGDKVGTKNLTAKKGKKATEGKTTTAGDKGTVKSATVGGITYGGFAGAKADGVVSVGAAGSERRIQNVAAGEISKTSTDAINGSQLYSTNAEIAKLSQKLGDLKGSMSAGIAGAYAAAALAQPHDPGASSVGVAVGNFRGESALSIGVSTISDNGRWILKGLVTHDSQSHTGAAASVNYQW
ncbi:YadA-like family protein [Pasteurella skyensis]|uniref:YadA-like family protein n=1 Tax=Phocoenobacter skyensis TaxID=97481 RepID=A0AAJ6NCC6_9PAST|nr:YadA-like family protein [Pasteurella skyensis]MDP8170368.1 YadA-like family protein [Pasteurella skyensis]MDP8174223.1 YadA-like family protein [Pasteurella skyensis]